MPSPLACTVVANNYLAYARAFTRSFLARHPDGQVAVLIADRPQPGHDYGAEPFAVTFVEDLGIPGFAHFAFRYSLLELATAVKPLFLLHLHRTLGADRLCYFDPDILVLGDLSPLYDRLGEADALVTPHLTAPLEDAAVPGERDILVSGTYNLGFLGMAFNGRTLAFLDWWWRRLYRECLHDVERGLFVDQRWMDLAPAFLPRLEILQDPGCNVAYWNLAHREIGQAEGRWTVNSVPLRFFHFSGYDPARPELVSKFQDRFTFAERQDVVPLFRLYAESVEREGQKEVQGYPYQYGRFDNGLAVPEVARRVLRDTDPEGHRWPDPFATGPGSFLAWLRQPVAGGADLALPRIAWHLWDQRPDLQAAFPRPWGADGLRFGRWLAGSAEMASWRDPVLATALAEAEARSARGAHYEATMAAVLRRRSRQGPEDAGSRLSGEELAWLTADAGHEPGRRPLVPRLALELHRRRSDVRRAFPDPLGANRLDFALWFATSARREYRLAGALVRPVLATLPLRRRLWARAWWQRQLWRGGPAHTSESAPADRSPGSGEEPRPIPSGATDPDAWGPEGVNVIGWPAAPTGVGEACRGTLAALREAGVASAVWSLDGPPGDRLSKVPAGAEALPYGISLFHANADVMEAIQAQMPSGSRAGRYRIGYWFWELAHFPLVFADAFRLVDEVWAPSRFCLETYRSISPVPVRWVPPCVAALSAAPADRAALGIDPGAFLFFFAFDALSVPERKNPAGLLEAFARVAAQSPRPVHLLLKVHHGEMEPAHLAGLASRAGSLPVTLLTRTLSRPELDALTAACDAYVSLHRSEGLGLPLIEAMYLGKPVIACGYGGVGDFLDETTGFVVRHRLVPLALPEGPYPAGAVWAEPDVEHAAELMTLLANDPSAAAGRVAAARERVQGLYSPAAAGRRLRAELERVRARG